MHRPVGKDRPNTDWQCKFSENRIEVTKNTDLGFLRNLTQE